jgi:hypothetical protein
MKESIVLLSFLKQRARQLKKEKSLRSSQALDEAARELGYSNYRNYLNVLESTRKQEKSSMDLLLEKISSENDMSKKIDLAIPFVQSPETSFHEILDILKIFQHSEKDMRAVCEKSNVKNEIKQYLLNDFLTGETEADISGFYENYIAKDISLSELSYQINGDMICVDGQYDLTIKSEFEFEDENYEEKESYFENYLLTGTFEITIDKNKKITVVDQTIGT